MNGAPPLVHEKLERIDTIVRAVDQRGRDMDQRWGFGRLPALVPIDVAERFKAQRLKFSRAIWEYDDDAARRHGEAMLRAYDKLDELACAAGRSPMPPEQWEIEGPDGEVIVVVRDLADVDRARLDGRKGMVWSLEEVASVIRAHPAMVAAKSAFPGALVETVRPPADAMKALNDELMELPL